LRSRDEWTEQAGLSPFNLDLSAVYQIRRLT